MQIVRCHSFLALLVVVFLDNPRSLLQYLLGFEDIEKAAWCETEEANTQVDLFLLSILSECKVTKSSFSDTSFIKVFGRPKD